MARSEGAPPIQGPPRGPWRGGPRRRLTLYDRRLQTANERWSLVPRSLARLFRHPELVLALLGKRAAGGTGREGIEPQRAGHAGDDEPFRRRTGGSPEAARRYDPAPSCAPGCAASARGHAGPHRCPCRRPGHHRGRPGPPTSRLRIYRRFGSGLRSGRDGRDLLPAIVYFHGGGWVDRGPRHPRRLVSDAGRGEQMPGGGRRLPAGSRAPVPRRRRRRPGRLRLGPPPLRRARDRRGPGGRDG